MDALTKETSVISRGDYLATQTYVLWSYIRLFFFPVGLHLDHSVVLAQGFISLQVIIALTGHLIAIASALYLRKKVPVVAFAILFYYLTHMVESSVIPIRDVLFEHRAYLPNVGLCLCVSWLITRFIGKRKEKMIAALSIFFLILALGGATWKRNNVWRDNVALWKDNLAKSGHTRRPLYNLANALHKQGKLDAAAWYYLETLQLDPAYAKAHNGLGIVYAKQGKLKEAEGHFLEASRLNPEFAQAHNSLGILYLKLGNPEKAIFHFQEALAIKPDYRIARANLEAALQQLNRSRQ